MKLAEARLTVEELMQGKEVIIRYLEDAEAAERNFEDALAHFSATGEQLEVKNLFESASRKAKTRHERLEVRLHALGGSPSQAKSLLAHLLAFTPTIAQIGHEGAEQNTQHLIVVVAAAAAEMAMYESLACAAAAAGDDATEQLGQLQTEEHEDYELAWKLLGPSAMAAFQTVLDRHSETNGVGVIKKYLEDAIAAEKSFETQLDAFTKEGDHPAVQAVFKQHAVETCRQSERLTRRLEQLGGSTFTVKSLLAHLFAMSPKAAQLGHKKEERTTQNLMMAFAVENSELALYEALARTAEVAGDSATVLLAREIQKEEKAMADNAWKLPPSVATEAFVRVATHRQI
jgi:ferritin-like metal-binding protein YciE